MRNYPLRLAILYFLMASVWIFISDWAVEQLVPEKYLTTAQTLKGFGFIVVTASALFFIVRHYYHLIQKNEAEYRQLFKDNPHPMWVYDLETLKFLTVNNAAIEKYKYSREEFYGMKITDIRPHEDQDSILMFVKRVETKNFHDSGIWRHYDKYGKRFFVKITSHSTFFEGKKARVVLAIDVDQQIEAQRKIQLSESKLKGLINNSDDLIWMLDSEGVVITANEAFQLKLKSILGIDIDLTKNMNINQLPESDLTRNWNQYFKMAFIGKKLRVEEEVSVLDKKEYFEIILNPIYNDNKEIIGVGCFARNTTHRKQSENQIQEQLQKLKDVAWIQSHELRKPVANILGLMELFKSEKDTNRNKELLEHMEASTQELDFVIKKIVDKTSSQFNPET